MALPTLQSLGANATAASTFTSSGNPLRLAYLYVPNGVHMPDWTPKTTGASFDLPRALQPLEAYKQDLLVLSGLAQDNARAHGDGGGDHARGAAAFLTGVHPLKTDGSDIRAGVSADQVAANLIGRETRFQSLHLACEPGRLAGGCDSGYSCAYSNTLSWRSPTEPIPNESNPGVVFDRLFGGVSESEQRFSRERRAHTQRSILDFVMDDARRLRRSMGAGDRRLVERYLEGVRDVERRVDGARAKAGAHAPIARPDGPPDDFGDAIRLMGDLMVLAFASDATRVCTLMFANEGSNRPYRELGQKEGHHSISHHNGREEQIEKIAQINRFHVQQLAYIVRRLDETREQDERLLDNTLLVYGSGISDGDRHDHHDLPILAIGRGGGLVTPGRHVRYEEQTPLMNLFLSNVQEVDERIERIGDSTGRLSGLRG